MEKLELLCGRRNVRLPVAGCRARRVPEAQDHGSSSFRVLPASSLVRRRRTAQPAATEKVQLTRTVAALHRGALGTLGYYRCNAKRNAAYLTEVPLTIKRWPLVKLPAGEWAPGLHLEREAWEHAGSSGRNPGGY